MKKSALSISLYELILWLHSNCTKYLYGIQLNEKYYLIYCICIPKQWFNMFYIRSIVNGLNKQQVAMRATLHTSIILNGRLVYQIQAHLSAFYCSLKLKKISLSICYWWKVENELPVCLYVIYWLNQVLIDMDFVIVNYKISSVSELNSIIYIYIYICMWLNVWTLAGEYTVVASTFEAELLGKFILTVASTVNLQVDPIPSEGAVSYLLDIFFSVTKLNL